MKKASGTSKRELNLLNYCKEAVLYSVISGIGGSPNNKQSCMYSTAMERKRIILSSFLPDWILHLFNFMHSAMTVAFSYEMASDLGQIYLLVSPRPNSSVGHSCVTN